MEDLITDLQIMVNAWRELPDGVGNIQVAASQIQGVINNHRSRPTQGAVDVVCTPRIGVDGKPSNVCACGRFIVVTTPLT